MEKEGEKESEYNLERDRERDRDEDEDGGRDRPLDRVSERKQDMDRGTDVPSPSKRLSSTVLASVHCAYSEALRLCQYHRARPSLIRRMTRV